MKMPPKPPKLIDQMHTAFRRQHNSYRTEQSFFRLHILEIVDKLSNAIGGSCKITHTALSLYVPLFRKSFLYFDLPHDLPLAHALRLV